MAELKWSDAQSQKVNDAVTEAFNKASVASAFLPLYGPLAGSAETVRNERLQQDKDADASKPITLDTDHDAVNLKLVNLTVKVELSSEQVADETLSNALLAFRRAANILALEEDRIVFQGFNQGDENSKFVANTINPQRGLADLHARQEFPDLELRQDVTQGQAVVLAVVDAISSLEEHFNSSPFACILGNALFNAVHDPSPSLVLPADRITPLLKGGPLLRSGKINDEAGIVVSLAGSAVDIVVGTPPTVQFLQRTQDAKFLFRVYERFTLRIRDKEPPVAGFRFPLDKKTRVDEKQTLVALAQAANRPSSGDLLLAEAEQLAAHFKKP